MSFTRPQGCPSTSMTRTFSSSFTDLNIGDWTEHPAKIFKEKKKERSRIFIFVFEKCGIYRSVLKLVVKLVLFDIDGTLIRTGGAGVKAFEETFLEVFGIPEATKTLKFAGRTDTSLVREGFVLHGIEPN